MPIFYKSKKLNCNCCIMEYAYKENDRYSKTFTT